jgi:CO dehydrogenase/acetyl-CoA synthase epsilon subunit
MMLGDIKDEVERGATAVTVSVVKIATLERDGAKQGVNGDGTVFVDGFAGQRKGVVGDELAVVKHFLDDATGVTGKGVAQAGFEPLG